MKLLPLLSIALFPLLLYGQKTRHLLLDLDDHPILQHDRSFIAVEAVDATGAGTGGYGNVYTGLVNTHRELHFRGGLTNTLKKALLLGVADPAMPRARLIVHDLRIDEEITMTSERRRLQLLVSLELTRDEEPLLLGPLQEAEIQGGMDVTGGHSRALSEAIGRLLDRFDTLLSEGKLPTNPAGFVRETDPSRLPDGAYHTYADYRIGRVDTSVHLIAGPPRWQANRVGLTFSEVSLEAGADQRVRNRKAVWGYHVDGRSYLQLANKFHELKKDREGRTLVFVKGGLVDPERITKQVVIGSAVGGLLGGALASAVSRPAQAHTLFEVDLRTGGLIPYEVAVAVRKSEPATLVSAEPEGGQSIIVHRNGERQFLHPGEVLLVDPEESLSFTIPGGPRKSDGKDFRAGITDQPALYQLSVRPSGVVKVDRLKGQAAREARTRITSAGAGAMD
ncbi:hypothetical protein [Lewinella sp. IMCC34183]|uniref:hypothetical protein n=1 Tax=Lewinella sp. IMCC34183 TaxID=2248762 RepID=UPI00130084FC|nr:hypothetical protein [Lewinella sp. IMCC34183]